jgi:hypothetical protein
MVSLLVILMPVLMLALVVLPIWLIGVRLTSKSLLSCSYL